MKGTALSVETMHLWTHDSSTFPGPANNIGIHTANHFNLPTVLKLSDQAESINLNPVTNGLWNSVMNLGEDEEESSPLWFGWPLLSLFSVFPLFICN